METKKCQKCNLEKDINDFYVDEKLSGGRVNTCKTCKRKRSLILYHKKMEDPEFVMQQRKRDRKNKRNVYSGVNYKRRAYQKNYRQRNPEKILAHLYSKKHIEKKEGVNYHHWSYNREHFLDVIELSRKDHSKAHRFLIYDEERLMYRRYDTMELLDTRERHEEFIFHCIKNKED